MTVTLRATLALSITLGSLARAQDNAPDQAAADQVLDTSPPGFFDDWTGSVAAGITGSSGNTDRFNFRTSLNLNRETDAMITALEAVYSYAKDDGTETENRARFLARNDWRFDDSPWRLFVLGTIDYDEFQNWDLRYTGIVGVGYEFVKNDRTTVLGRAGIGGTYEQGGTDEEFTPEGLLAIDVSHQLTERSKITATAEYYPSFDDLTNFRLIGRAAYEVLVDPELNLTLRLGVEDRYDSDPGDGFKRNDIDYFATLVWSF